MDRAFIPVGELHHDFVERAGARVYESAEGHAFAGELRLVADPPDGNRLVVHGRWSRGEGGSGIRCAHAEENVSRIAAGCRFIRGAGVELGVATRGGATGSKGARSIGAIAAELSGAGAPSRDLFATDGESARQFVS